MSVSEESRVVVRRVGVNRIDDLLALESACFESDRISRKSLRHLLKTPTASCVAAYCSGQLTGSMIMLFRKNSRIARIYSIAVLEAERGRGIGQQLMAFSEREARTRGCTQMQLEVRMENVKAISFYERLGYVAEKVLPGYYEDAAHAFLMRRELD